MRLKPAHTLLRPLLMLLVMVAYFALGDDQVTQLVALYTPATGF
ncbi:MAG: hypothetical protein ACPGZU_21485 [Ketobacter sp.]|nr:MULTISPECIES: hypothetical protein [unclassified Ketobacter]MEC8811717.1 hypothetical protein [Pseudomonadota bacterium]